jgi:hypothetical protein
VIVEQEDSYHSTMLPDQARHRKEARAGSLCLAVQGCSGRSRIAQSP